MAGMAKVVGRDRLLGYCVCCFSPGGLKLRAVTKRWPGWHARMPKNVEIPWRNLWLSLDRSDVRKGENGHCSWNCYLGSS